MTEVGIAVRRIAEAIGRELGLLVEGRIADHSGWFARMAGGDMAGTVDARGWVPTRSGLLSALAEPGYYAG